MSAPFLIEDVLIARLKTLSTVTALVGADAAARIRPGVLDQSDTLPAITLRVVEELHESSLDEEADQNDQAYVEICAIAATHRAARLLQKAIEFNGTIPGTGLNGASSPGSGLDDCTLIGAVSEVVDLKDDAGGKREVMRLRYLVTLCEPSA